MEKTTSKTTVWEYIKYGLFLLVTGVLSLYIVIAVFLPDQTVKIFGFKPYVVISQSMEPVIDRNDVVVVNDFAVEELKVGDIITFRTDINYDGEKEVVTHYIYSINKNNNNDYSFKTHRYFSSETEIVPDTWLLLEEDILGEYMFQLPAIGSIILFLQSPFGIVAMLVNIGIIVAVVILLKQGKKEREEFKKLQDEQEE
ncbi:signal peptidase I [Haloplasma contractile]|uniref:Signal peptidase I n=1 Tax=Haloplasma contractile SSD-17B TaxID=1033810 RepID=U2DT18_9MOLU|nr:signal peptidase I [Haloplasma contractile]ERJ11637.1 signal peptidase endoplasmic reticulum-type protein [Haloplasma contractile SSD-17B]